MTFRILMQNDCVDVSDAEFKRVVKALNIQLSRDFYYAWGIDAELVLVTKKTTPLQAKANGIIYLKDAPPDDGYLGYHDSEFENGMPYGFTFQDVSAELGEPWSVTMSHEVLELVLNRNCNFYAFGPHPKQSQNGRNVAFWLEACDAVQDQTYFINGVEVSDFVYPAYFTPHNEKGSRNNHIEDKPVPSFGLTAGGYLGYFDPKTGKDETVTMNDRAKLRYAAKARMGDAKRSQKHVK